MDEDGYVWYEGRADDVIISAGYRIGPFEVESACLEHPAVAEAAAVASPDERRGSIVKAFIVLAEGYEPTDENARAIQQHVRTAVAPTTTRGGSSSSPTCRRRSPGRSAGSSCARRRRGACARPRRRPRRTRHSDGIEPGDRPSGARPRRDRGRGSTSSGIENDAWNLC